MTCKGGCTKCLMLHTLYFVVGYEILGPLLSYAETGATGPRNAESQKSTSVDFNSSLRLAAPVVDLRSIFLSNYGASICS